MEQHSKLCVNLLEKRNQMPNFLHFSNFKIKMDLSHNKRLCGLQIEI
jgi:hypothetical protein